MRKLLFVLLVCLMQFQCIFCGLPKNTLKSEVKDAVKEFLSEYQETVKQLQSEITHLKMVVRNQQGEIIELKNTIGDIFGNKKTPRESENEIGAGKALRDDNFDGTIDAVKNVDKTLTRNVNDAHENLSQPMGMKKRYGIVQTSLSDKQPSVVNKRQSTPHVAFCAYLDHVLSHVDIGNTIVYNKIITNDGHAYNPGTGVFTAPVTGVYLFMYHYDSDLGKTEIRLVVNDANIVGSVVNHETKVIAHALMGGNSAIVHVTMGQTAWTETTFANDQQISSLFDAHKTTFSGVLLYSTE